MALDLSTVQFWNAPNRAGLPLISGEDLIEALVQRVVVDMSKRVSVVGQNIDVDTGTVPEDIWVGAEIASVAQNLYVFPGAAQTLSIVSTSVDDDAVPPGTGLQRIQIQGLGASFEEIVEEIDLDGTTPVITTSAFLRVNNVFAVLAGSGGVNAGDIVLSQTGSGIVIAAMAAGDNRALQAVFTVPASFENGAVISQSTLSIGRQAAADIEVSLLARLPGNTAFFPETRVNFNSQGSSALGGLNVTSDIFEAGTDFVVRCTEVSASNTGITVDLGFREPDVVIT